MAGLDKIQTEIAKVFEKLGTSVYSEAIIAKKIRDNVKFTNKKKAGLRLADLEKAAEFVAQEKSVFLTFRLNSVNEILIRKTETADYLAEEERHRRLTSEHSMTFITSSDIPGGKK